MTRKTFIKRAVQICGLGLLAKALSAQANIKTNQNRCCLQANTEVYAESGKFRLDSAIKFDITKMSRKDALVYLHNDITSKAQRNGVKKFVYQVEEKRDDKLICLFKVNASGRFGWVEDFWNISCLPQECLHRGTWIQSS